MSRLLICIAAGLIQAFALASAARSDEPPLVFPVRGEPFSAKLARINEDWNVRFDAGEHHPVLPITDFSHWGTYRDREKGPQIVLADGGLIVADEVSIVEERVEVTTRLFEPFSVPLELVRGIIFHPPPDSLDRDRLYDKLVIAEGTKDELLLANGDQLQGLLVPADKKPKADEPPKLQIGAVTVAQENVVALTCNPVMLKPADPQNARARLGFSDGSCLVVERITPQNDHLSLTLPGGVKIKTFPDYEPATIFEDVTLVQSKTPRAIYVSDLETIGYKSIPFLSVSWPYKNNQNALGGRLRAGENVFVKGIGMHSTSRLAYDVPDGCHRFAAELAIDSAAAKLGSVTFRIFTDNGEGGGLKPIYKSPVVRGGQQPLPISLDIQGSRRIILIVDFADRGDQGDHANWLNARLLK